MFSQIKDRKHIEQNFHSVAKVMPRGEGAGGVPNFSVGICDWALSTARFSFIFIHRKTLSMAEVYIGYNLNAQTHTINSPAWLGLSQS